MSIQLELKVTAGTPIYRGHDHYWSVIKDLGRDKGLFTRREVALRSNDRDDHAVADYIKRLHAAGFLEMVEQQTLANPEGGTSRHNVYRLIKRQAATPIVRRDGSLGTQGLSQLQIWNTMRALPSFTSIELAVSASTATIEVPQATANRYARHLQDAGYLQIMRAGGAKVQRIWRLKPSMNTGPNPPKIMGAKIVYDTNRKQIMGTPVAEECAA
jgi:Mn-dependent DtxR family transcriptional regulator